MDAIHGEVPDGARELTTGQSNRVWLVGDPVPYVLKHYSTSARAANEAAALALLARRSVVAPRLLAAGPRETPPWTAQTVIDGAGVAADRFLDRLAAPLHTVHRVPGPYAGRIAGATRHAAWRSYLHERLDAYVHAAPALAPAVALLRREVSGERLDMQPRLLHHDLRADHLLLTPEGGVLLDWELAAFGDPLSDLARLAVRLRLPEPADVLALARQPGPADRRRLDLYWRIHQIADAAFSTDAALRTSARQLIATWAGT